MTDSEFITRARRTSVPGFRAMVGVSTAILVGAGLYRAAPVFAPLAFTLFIIAMVCPLHVRLQAALPKLGALGVSMLATVFAIGAFAWVIISGCRRVVRGIGGRAGLIGGRLAGSA